MSSCSNGGCGCGARSQDVAAGRRLEYLTVGWNVTEAAIAVGAGILAGSAALVGFGVDSVIESISGLILLWRLSDVGAESRRDERALRLVGLSFLILAAWVGWEALESLLRREPPSVSITGVVLALVSVIVMPLLARAKRRVAKKLRSAALLADSRQTDLCAWLSAILLGGLLLHAALGWWWADPTAALLMVPIILNEGVKAMQGQTCADCH